ncbi:HET domain-containing protein [Fusarium falciforme]|uniref:HET domain-containing protein n=1 Tax=Fusarium falciforme TaxID=195108 RepID=UPI00230009A8|nr:HET domain-containing protein [Fusarium falciforme]WAO95574.1 HET domain-containing protein [Fusarium falciforme]
MSFSYQPLASDEIRLVKIEPAENGDDSQPILCTIEHVNLVPGVTVSPDRRFKGHSDAWPEISNHHDTDALFDKGRDPFAVSQGPSPSLDEEARLPWRYPWGDFIALSYEWGPPTPRRFITVNGAQFGVTPNLYDALIQLRRTQRIRQGFRLWIDAICINQDDLAERGQQVARMRDIYRSAWQVVIWIGPEADDSSLALSALHWLANQSRRPTPLEGVYHQGMAIDARPFFVVIPGYQSPLRRAVYKALFCFFTRTYWRRMWIIQEVANGRPGAPVLCGNRCIAWDDIYRAAVVINNDQARLGRDILDSSRPPLAALNTYEFARDRLAEDTHLSSERLWGMQVALGGIQLNQKLSFLGDWQALTLVLNLCRDSNVTEEKDRVYGILGIKAVADRVAVVPDYTLGQYLSAAVSRHSPLLCSIALLLLLYFGLWIWSKDPNPVKP